MSLPRFADRPGHPAYYELLEDLYPRMAERFLELLEIQAELHEAKDGDYSDGRPLSNFDGVTEFGIPRVDGVIARITDKWARFQTLHKRQRLDPSGPLVIDESKHDTMQDLAAYLLIAVVLEREDAKNS